MINLSFSLPSFITESMTQYMSISVYLYVGKYIYIPRYLNVPIARSAEQCTSVGTFSVSAV